MTKPDFHNFDLGFRVVFAPNDLELFAGETVAG